MHSDSTIHTLCICNHMYIIIVIHVCKFPRFATGHSHYIMLNMTMITQKALMSVPCTANKMEQADPTWCWINRHFGPQNAQWLRFSNNGSFLLNTSLDINCLWWFDGVLDYLGAWLFMLGNGKPWLSKSKAIAHDLCHWSGTNKKQHEVLDDWHLCKNDKIIRKQVTGRRGHGRVHTNLAASTIQTVYVYYAYCIRIHIYIHTDMNILHDMTKAYKCYEKQCTIQTVDWWNQATKLWSHMKSVWALQAIKSQLRRWWPCKIYWAMVPRQSFHEQFSEIHVVSRDTVETMTTSIMEEMQIMQSLHLSKNAGALPFTKSLP